MSEKISILLFLAIFVMNFASNFAATIFDSEQKPKREEVSKEICETPGCIRAAAQILNKMDLNVQPCDDFYRFACGRYLRETAIPDGESSVSAFSTMNKKLEEQLRKSLESEISNDEPQAFKLVKTYYNTCMDTAQIEKNSELEFRQILKELGGWPVLDGDSWDESSFDWLKSTYKLRRIGYSRHTFFRFSVTSNPSNNSRSILMIDRPALSLAPKYLLKGLKNEVVKAYHDYLTDLAEILGVDRENARVELREAINFGIELAKIATSKEEPQNTSKFNITENQMTVTELESRYPAVPWTEYMNEILSPHAAVNGTDKVIVSARSFLDKLPDLISRTPKRVLANYAISHVITSSAKFLSERFRNAGAKFSAEKSRMKSEKPRWKECLSEVLNDFDVAIGALYVRRNFEGIAESKAKASEIIRDIRNSFRHLIIQVNWMDEIVKKAALEKLDGMVSYVGYPEAFLENEKLDEYYKHMEIHPTSFLKSHLSTNLFSTSMNFAILGKDIKKSDWIYRDEVSASVRAVYMLDDNTIQIPAGMLQGDFFSNDRPNYLNYGAIGFAIGHEMSHGFDNDGQQFDKHGNTKDWWDSETKDEFLNKAKCVIDKYSNYTVTQDGLKINGKNTQDENFADHVGIRVAYSAYNGFEKRHRQEARLPGLPYTSQQMFWISAANIWCGKYMPDKLKLLVLTGVHSPNEFRVNGAMSDMQEFSKDFDCSLGSPMNPVEKCSVL